MSHSREVRFTLPGSVLVYTFLLLGLGSALLLSTLREAAVTTAVLFAVVTCVGIWFCRTTQSALGDPRLHSLATLWLIKVTVLLFVLYVGWIPQLDPGSSSWGYDPQRYYVQAQELIDNQWMPTFVSLNYTGILYFYGAIFFLFGHNPIVPALFNALLTLIATLYLIRTGYEVVATRGARDTMLAVALLLPELIWFDVMTSRETLLAAVILVGLLSAGRYFARTGPVSGRTVVGILGISGFIIAAIRPSMLPAMLIAVALLVILVSSGRRVPRWRGLIILAVLFAIVSIVPTLTATLGGYAFDFQALLRTAFFSAENIAASPDAEWAQNSIGLLLMPAGYLQAVLFVPARMLLYLVAPLPNILPFNGLLEGSWSAWQTLFLTLSSILNLVFMPYVLASLVTSIRNRRRDPGPLMFHISYWAVFATIAGGNLIIHERYRVMASLLFWGCAWLGMKLCTSRQVLQASVFFYGLLSLAAVFYVTYKAVA